ncbi:endonuclease/exonuclease/phosphatase family protein [Cellulomonas sp. HZM]|uniref:endonuclease/exonuclease/phosphatase family protein n=1 Tax=Cellulomonas sp. HZM TaxID=1454010 RepID=UPI00049312B5|nr:endonuclease/exonuclease/phosphatase family protein [Cellulomonas sp. HZM]
MPRRRSLPALVAAFLAAVLTLGLLPAAPASAATAAPTKVVAVPGVTQVTVEWHKVSGASKYQVQVSTSKSFKKPKKVSTTSTRTTVKSLKVRTVYWVRVRAGSGSWSTKTSVTTTTRSPRYKEGVKVVGAGTDKVKLTWPRYAQATSLKIVASWDNSYVYNGGKAGTSGISASRTWTTSVPVTRTSAVLTVPAKWRALMGSRGTAPVFVRLYAKNGSVSAQSVTAFGYPSAPARTGHASDDVRFATWNVESSTASAGFTYGGARPDRTWDDRKAAVVAGIRYADADVVAVQEAAASKASGYQYQELARKLSGTYASAVPIPTVEAKATASSRTAGASKSDHLLVRTSAVKILDSGVHSTYTVSGGVKWDSSKFDRWFTWALLQSKTTGAKFYAVSTHLEQGTSSTVQGMRKAAMKGVRGYVESKAKAAGLAGVPIVVMGDLNSDTRWVNGPQVDMVKAGYTSATNAAHTVRRWDTTSNHHTGSADDGYPTKPYRYAYTGTRIDYVLVKNGSGVDRFVNQMVLTSSGKFDERYRGSDHNLQWADVRIR